MNLDWNELHLFELGPGMVFPSKLEHAEGQRPIEWLVNEIKKNPLKVVRQGNIVGEAIALDPENGHLEMNFYEKPIPVMTDADWEEHEKRNS